MSLSVCGIVLMNCLLNEFAMYVGVMTAMSLNVMELLMDCGGFLLDNPAIVFHSL